MEVNGVVIAERWAERYKCILLSAAESGGEFACDEDVELARAIEDLSAAEAQIAVLHGLIEKRWTDQCGDHACGCGEWPECVHTIQASEMRSAAMKIEIGILAPTAPKPDVHSEHWRNPETGQVECECCCSWALDCEQDRKQIATLRAAGGTALYEMGFATSNRPEFARAVEALDAALAPTAPRIKNG